MGASIYVATPFLLLLAVLQAAVLPHFPVLGFVPQLLFLVALAWGALRGVNEGVVWAFVAGVCQDLFSTIPMGVSSLTFMVAVLAAVLAAQVFPQNRFFLPLLQGAAATFIFLGLHFILLNVMGYGIGLETAVSLLPLIILHSVLILPIYWLLDRLINALQPRRVQL
ncbi:MAG: rod shape-determining protein MreD [Ardenticatenaceae bacterium]|nr:rod shape-determining protein MreD [Ardenticatenaceae bacterium]